MKNLLVAQSGGPTSVINSSVAGVIKTALVSGKIGTVYGGVNGIQGILNENLIDLTSVFSNYSKFKTLYQTPSAALGSCRFKLKSVSENEEQYEKLIQIFRKFNINYFIYIGGNDSMDTVHKLTNYLSEKNITDIIICGVPKTIDNDLSETDHCPGFGSTAKYLATVVSEVKRDINVYEMNAVTIIEAMGRNTGWIAASSALAGLNKDQGPDLIYLCENTFDNDKFLSDINEKFKHRKALLVVVSEGIKYANNEYVSSSDNGMVDDFGHSQLSGVSGKLSNLVKRKFDVKTRGIELSLIQRCAAHFASATDIHEASMLGSKGVMCALEGLNGHMATIIRNNNAKDYSVSYGSAPVSKIANFEKTVPSEWISEKNAYVTQEFLDYASPLIVGENNLILENGLPKHTILY